MSLLDIGDDDLVVDIGSNDGTLLSKFEAGGHKTHGIEPTDAADLAVAAGIPTTKAFFTPGTAQAVKSEAGKAMVITATNCFAHIENIHDIVDGVLTLLDENGVFVSESHYLMALLDTVQYDTIYHEHYSYLSLRVVQRIAARVALEVDL